MSSSRPKRELPHEVPPGSTCGSPVWMPPRHHRTKSGRSTVLIRRAWRLLGACSLLLTLQVQAEPARREPTPMALCRTGLSATGGTGLFDLPIAEAGCPWRLRLSVQVAGFAQSGYLLLGDRHTQLAGTVQLAASLGHHVEAFAWLGGRDTRNQRPLSTDTQPTAPILALGQTSLGFKLHADWGTMAHAALLPYLRFHSGPDDLGPSVRGLDLGLDLLGSVELQRRFPRLPLRLHFLFGYVYDRSSQLLSSQDCMALGGAECLATRLIATAGYGVGQPRLRLGLGVDATLELARHVWLQPLLVYRINAMIGDGDPVVAALLRMQATEAPVDDRLAQWLTLGGRLGLGLPMTLELGLQLGLQSAGYAMGQKLPAVAGYGALTWELDLTSSHPEPPSREGLSQPASEQQQLGAGSVVGVVVDAQTQVPLPDAVVRFVGAHHNAVLTDERGEFRSAPLSARAVVVEASRGDHQTGRQVVLLRGSDSAQVRLLLPPIERHQLSRLQLELREESGPIAAATAVLSRQGQSVELSMQAGLLVARVPAGPWLLRADASGYLSREQLLVLPVGSEQRLTLQLSRRPKVPRVQLGTTEILLGEPIQFLPAAAELTSESAKLLDEVVDLLVHHAELRSLRILLAPEAGSAPLIAEQQAIAVRNYLVQHGVAPERAVAEVLPAIASKGRGPRVVLSFAPDPSREPK